jgi:hypothetical protein
MRITYNKFLIVSTLVILIGGVYLYFSKNLDDKEIVPVAYGSSLVSSSAMEPLTSLVSTAGDKISTDISFLTTLVSLKKITIDTSLFSSKSFTALKNNAVKIDQMEPGRSNPFAPINTSKIKNVATTVSKVVTEQPTQITNSTAILNGTVNVANGVTDLYFEYGTTESLGTTTTTVQQSLVGTFIKNVSGLNPKTNYFFKACAKINSVATCGEVVSFTTN